MPRALPSSRPPGHLRQQFHPIKAPGLNPEPDSRISAGDDAGLTVAPLQRGEGPWSDTTHHLRSPRQYGYLGPRALKNQGKTMRMVRFGVYAAALCGTIMALMGPAEARHLRRDYVATAYVCGPVPPPVSLYIFPAPNWEPFFRRHFDRYGPIVACEARAETTNVISVRY